MLASESLIVDPNAQDPADIVARDTSHSLRTRSCIISVAPGGGPKSGVPRGSTFGQSHAVEIRGALTLSVRPVLFPSTEFLARRA
jgi:hypothetical protein